MDAGQEKHDTPAHLAIARDGTIFRCLVGSQVHGVSVGSDDRDEMGVCIEPPEYVMGLKRFEQYEHHTAWERPGGRANRSEAGDLDVVVYSLRKWLRLALKGNPSILVPLFVRPDHITVITEPWQLLILHTKRILSREAGHRFLGYLASQRTGMLGERSKNVTRPELIERYGFDTKFAGHAIRLGYQGIQLMESGFIDLPMPEAQRHLVTEVRTGKYNLNDCVGMVDDLIDRLKGAIEESGLPEHANWEWANRFLVSTYQEEWLRRDLV